MRVELLSSGVDTAIHIEIVAQIVCDPAPKILEPLAEGHEALTIDGNVRSLLSTK